MRIPCYGDQGIRRKSVHTHEVFRLGSSQERARNSQIPCIFPVYQGIWGREWFASDCAIQRPVTANRCFSFASDRLASYVIDPLPMKNSNNAVVYYLFFA